MTTTCPNGHQSGSTDYCDTCGAPMGTSGGSGEGSAAAPSGAASGGRGAAGAPAGGAPSPSGGSASQTCTNCGVENVPDALFCEACGYDFTTGAMPRVPTPLSSLDLGAPSGPPGSGGGASEAPRGPASPDSPSEAQSAGANSGSGSPNVGASGSDPVATLAGGGTGGSARGASSPNPTPLAPPVTLEWVVEAWVDPDWHAEQHDAEPCPSPGLPRIVPLSVRSVLIGRLSRSRNIRPEIECSPDNGVSRRHAQLTTDGSRWWIEDLQSSNGTYVGPDSGPLPTTPLTPGVRQELREGDRIYVGAWTRLVVRRATDEEKAA